MKRLCLILLISIALIFKANAQDEKIKEVTNLFCNCINMVMDDFHPQLKKMIIDIGEVGQTQAEQNLIQYLMENQDEIEKVMSDTKRMENIEELLSTHPNCETIFERAEKLGEDVPDLGSKMRDYLNSQADCKLTSAILKTALKDNK
jgi:hypothetical protein